MALVEGRKGRELLVSLEREADKAIHSLPGRWTPLIEVWAESVVGPLPAVLSLRLAERGGMYRVETSPLVALEGWAVPSELCFELAYETRALEAVEGPPLHIPMGYELLERADPGLARASREADALLEVLSRLSRRGLDACILHLHLLYGANHTHLGALWPEHPYHSSEAERKAWEVFEAAYRLCDEFIGRAVEIFGAGPETVVVVISDHGALPAWRMVRIARVLADAGLLLYRFDEGSRTFVVDWDRTRAFPYAEPTFLWVNLKGREPHGIVEPGSEYEEVREAILDLLLSLRDPATGRRVMACVLKWEEAVPLLGEGERIGDVVYFPRPRYQLFDGLLHDIEPYLLLPQAFEGPAVAPSKRVTGYHACYLPTARLGHFSVAGVFVASGESVGPTQGRVQMDKVFHLILSWMGLPPRPKRPSPGRSAEGGLPPSCPP